MEADYLYDPYDNAENEFYHELVSRIGREHSVIIYFHYGLEDDGPFYELSGRLRNIIEENRLGIYDGHEMALDNTDGSYYIYGPNAEDIYKAIKPTLESTFFMKGATAILTFGPTGTNAPQLELEV